MSKRQDHSSSREHQGAISGTSANTGRRHFLHRLMVFTGAAALLPLAGSLGSKANAASPQSNRTILITGATSGMGRYVAEQLAAPGMTLLIHGRDEGRAQQVLTRIREAGANGQFYRADFTSLEEVRGLATAIQRDHDRLDVLVNNAGVGTGKPGAGRQVSKDGHELRFAVNYLAPFLLTQQLLPLLKKSQPSRIINIASSGQNPLDFNDVMLTRDYQAQRAYGQSKLALIMFTFDLAQELGNTGVTVNALHPANYMDTAMVRESGMRPWNSVEEGGDALLQLINSPEVEGRTGQYFSGLSPSRASSQAYDQAARDRLRELSIQLTTS